MRRVMIAILAVCASVAVSAQVVTETHPQKPVFAGGATVVPVDVRVTDSRGRPITDLKESDFTVLENGVRQNVTYFSAHALSATTTTGASGTDASGGLAPQNRRVFLIVLGRGRLEVVSHGVQAAEDFVKTGLLPQDEVAIIAWNRATDFSTDHAKAIALLDLLKTGHVAIEGQLSDWFSGLRGEYGPKEVPASIQAHIDQLFQSAGVPLAPIPDVGSPNEARMSVDRLDQVQALQEQSRITSLGTGLGTTGNPGAQQSALNTGLLATLPVSDISRSFDEYVADEAKAEQDLSKLYAGIEFLRAVQGEKHLVYISQTGLFLPRVEDDKDLASRASDARVVIDTIQTGGGPTVPLFEPSDALLNPQISGFGAASMERLAETTGGTASIYSLASKGFDAINQATSFQYLLGYSPVVAAPDGLFRSIEVKVNHPGALVAYRHGYFAFPRMALSEQQVTTYARVLTNASGGRQDFKMKASVTDVTTPARAIDVAIVVDPSQFTFVPASGAQHTALDIALFVNGVSDWHTVDLDIPDADFDHARKRNVTFTLRLPVSNRPSQVVVVVYNYAGDVVSTYAARER